MSDCFVELRDRIRGPVYPVVVPFGADGSLDERGLRAYVEFLVGNGAGVVMLTAGTSRLNLLTVDELVVCNQIVVQAAGEAFAIVSGPTNGGVEVQASVLERAAADGAEAALLIYPERHYGDDAVAAFFHEIAGRTELGLLVHAVPMRDGFGGVRDVVPLGAAILEQIARAPAVIGVKEENGDRAVFDEVLALRDRLAVIGAGGAMRRFMRDQPLGAGAYLVGVESCVPRLGRELFDAVTSGRLDVAEQLATEHEDPFFPVAVSLGWHRALKEALAALELMSGHERAPLTRLNPLEQLQVAELVDRLGWRDANVAEVAK